MDFDVDSTFKPPILNRSPVTDYLKLIFIYKWTNIFVHFYGGQMDEG